MAQHTFASNLLLYSFLALLAIFLTPWFIKKFLSIYILNPTWRYITSFDLVSPIRYPLSFFLTPEQSIFVTMFVLLPVVGTLLVDVLEWWCDWMWKQK